MTGVEHGDGPVEGSFGEVRGGLRAAVEALMMVSDGPVTAEAMADALGVDAQVVLTAVAQVQERYRVGEHGVQVQQVAGGWQVVTRPDLHEFVSGLLVEETTTKLSQAALETLAVVAYQQPVTRSRIAAVRGVNVDGVVRTLVARGLIEEVPSADESYAKQYGTTSYFLQRLGLNSLRDLPPLAPHLPDRADIEEIAGDLP